MSRRELYRVARGAFLYLYLYLVMLAVFGALAAFFREEQAARLLLILAVADLAAAVLAKWGLILDLIEGRTETFCGQIDHRENAGSLRSVRVEYLVEGKVERPRRFVHFPDALPIPPEKMQGLFSGSVALWYLPRSFVVVRAVEGEGSTAKVPPPRTKEWYRQKPQMEEVFSKISHVEPCRRLREDYWFWEMLPTGLFLVFAGLVILFRLL